MRLNPKRWRADLALIFPTFILLTSVLACSDEPSVPNVKADVNDGMAPNNENNTASNTGNNQNNTNPNNANNTMAGMCVIDADCEGELVCGASSTCVEAGVGGCTVNDPVCADGLRCDEETGECVPVDMGCTVDSCGEGERCDDVTGACVPVEPECAEDPDCGDAEICEDDACVLGCRTDAACDDGEICDDSVCVSGCRDDGGCGDSERCEDGVCVNSCVDDAGCTGDGEICEDAVCVIGCREDAACGDGEICEDATCQAGCRETSDCDDLEICADMVCATGCVDDAGCQDGEICTESACVAGCRADDGCDDGEICADDACVVGCRDDSACQNDEICTDDACVTGCRDESGCDNGEACVDNLCTVDCTDDSGCAAGEICTANFCVAGCRADDGCGAGEICTGDVCVVGCRADDGCGTDEICTDSACVAGCRADDGCDAGEICTSDACVAGCRTDDGCDAGEICTSDACVTGCRDDNDCGADQSCTNNVCVDDDPAVGLDARPANPACVAPDRPASGTEGLEVVNAYPSLPGFTLPVLMIKAPGDDSRWYVVEKAGYIYSFQDSPTVSSTTLFANIDARVRGGNSFNDERGLLGMAFHPDYPNTNEVYLSYIATVNGGNGTRVSRFTVGGGGTLNTGAGQEQVIMEFPQPASNHNGGDIRFGPDGYLYIAIGDGGGANDQFGHGQNTNSVFAAINRIDVDSNRGGNPPYGIPADNPFVGSAGVDEIYAYGLRNPWRMSFDTLTGQLWLADVGQGAFEEVDQIVLGGNYGWPIFEGFSCFRNDPRCNDGLDLVEPRAVYGRSEGQSTTGGYVYRGSAIPGLNGHFIYGDFASGRVWSVPISGGDDQVLLDTGFNISSFGQDEDGEVYVMSYGAGTIHRLQTDTPGGGDPFPAMLSQTGCVDPGDPAAPAAGVIPYTVNAPFWSDGADKERFFAIPDGTSIGTDADGDFLFPIGTVTMKHFRLGGELFETRLFVRHDDGDWGGYTYRWNAQGTDAALVGVDGLETQVDGQDWLYPGRNQCLTCHTTAAGRSLGLEVAQLNGDLTYPATGRTANQLATLTSVGLLDPLPAPPAALPALTPPSDVSADLIDRARGYLHSNCAGCHRPGGTGRGNLDFTYWNAELEGQACGVEPLLDDLGIAGAFLVDPGEIDTSIIYQRAILRDEDGMPPLGSFAVDGDGATLLQQWVESDFCDGFEPESSCTDGIDNNMMNGTDCADPSCLGRPGCEPFTCNNPVLISTNLPASIEGSTVGLDNNATGGCSSNNAPEAVFAFEPIASGTYCIDTIGSGYDTFLHVRTSCTQAGSEVACNDDITPGSVLTSRVQLAANDTSTYFVFVDGYDGSGDYVLNVSMGACP